MPLKVTILKFKIKLIRVFLLNKAVPKDLFYHSDPGVSSGKQAFVIPVQEDVAD